jgi:hypothetical protein
MDAKDERTFTGPASFIYAAIFVLVTWPVTLFLGFLDTILIDNPDDKLYLLTPVTGAAVGGLVVLTIIAVRRYRQRRTESHDEPEPEVSWSKSASAVLCPNCGYEGVVLKDPKGKMHCPWCDHRINQDRGAFVPESTYVAVDRDQPGEPAVGAWYFSRDGQEQEPVHFPKLKRLVGLGRLGATTKVWREGMPEWMMIRDLPGLFADARNGKAETQEEPAKASRGPHSNGVPELTSPLHSSKHSKEDEWYYVSGDNGQPFGPITFAELRKRAARHEIFPTDLVLGNGSEWTEARFVADLFSERKMSKSK